MRLARPVTTALRTLQAALWIFGSYALSYCIFLVWDAHATQQRLAHDFEQTRFEQARTAKNSSLLPAASYKPTNAVKPASRAARAPSMGRLAIARLGVSAMILEGADSRVLRLGLGHIPGTSEPGDPGNIAIAGHRDTFFRPLRHIREGDEIVLETVSKTYHYSVNSTEVVSPTDLEVLQPHDRDELTLITCYPFNYLGQAPQRFIVHAVLVNTKQ
jgi:sortase A